MRITRKCRFSKNLLWRLCIGLTSKYPQNGYLKDLQIPLSQEHKRNGAALEQP